MVRCPPIMTALAATVTPGGNGGTAPPDDGIPNFRRVGKFQSLYRCGAPDGVADAIQRSPSSSGPDRNDDPPPLTESERFLLHDVTLWIDLRFDREADTERCDAIMQYAPGGTFEKVAFDDPRGLESVIKTSWMANQRLYLHFERPLFSTESYIRHVTEHWVDREAMERVASDKEAQQALIVEVIRDRGLLGLYEVVLEHGPFITNVLQAITLHLEQQQQQQLQEISKGAEAADGGAHARILIHCTLGKDRTGLICMLCQVMMGDDEKDILQEFSRSECVRELAKEKMKKFMDGKITGMERCDEETMAATLNYLKVQYGSVDGYLDNIGFDRSWRERFVSVAA